MQKPLHAILWFNNSDANYYDIIQNSIEENKILIDTIIEKVDPNKWINNDCYDSINNKINIQINVASFDDDNILTKSNFNKGEIILNSKIFTDVNIYKLNDNEISLVTLILFKNTLRILCKGWGESSLIEDNKYNKGYGLDEYKFILDENSLSSNIDDIKFVPLQNMIGNYSEYVEFKNISNDEDLIIDTIIDGMNYPILINEILNPYVFENNYLSRISAGLLQDIDGIETHYDDMYFIDASDGFKIATSDKVFIQDKVFAHDEDGDDIHTTFYISISNFTDVFSLKYHLGDI